MCRMEIVGNSVIAVSIGEIVCGGALLLTIPRIGQMGRILVAISHGMDFGGTA